MMILETADDITLIRMVQAGNAAAYAGIVNRYRQYVFTLAMRYVGNREIAEELAQDSFLKAYRYLADFRGNCKFSTWLYTIVNTTCLSYVRKKKEQTVYLEHEKMIAVADRSPTNHHTSSLSDQRTQKKIIAEVLCHLPDTEKQIITLFYQGEQTIEEISTILGITTANVKVKLFRARQKMKEIMETKFSRELF